MTTTLSAKRTVRTLTMIFLALPLVSSAQFINGGTFIGGVINSTMTADPNSSSPYNIEYSDQFSITPSLGFVMSDKMAFGVRLSYSHSFLRAGSSTYTLETNDLSAGLFLTQFFSLGSDKIWFTISEGVDYGRSKQDANSGPGYETDSEGYFTTVDVRPGFVYFPTEHWAVTMNIGNFYWRHDHTRMGTEETENMVVANLGSIGFGIQYFFK